MYAMFVTIMIRVHTFPLFVIRPMYLALRQFQKTLVSATAGTLLDLIPQVFVEP